MSDANGAIGIMGQIVSWEVPSSVTLDCLKDAVSEAGLPSELVKDMADQNALKRALADMRKGRVIRKLRHEGERVYFQLTSELVTSDEAYYSREAEVCLDTITGYVSADVPEIEVQAVALLTEHRNKRLTSDLTRLVQKVYEDCGGDLIPIRRQGGAYFVPASHQHVVDATRVLLCEIGGKLRSFEVRLGSAETRESVADSLCEYLSDLITELRESCAGITNETRNDVITRRGVRIKELKDKLSCYRGLLMASAGRIEGEIQDAEDYLIQLITAPVASVSEGTESAVADDVS